MNLSLPGLALANSSTLRRADKDGGNTVHTPWSSPSPNCRMSSGSQTPHEHCLVALVS